MTSDLRRAWASVLRALKGGEVVVFEFPEPDDPGESAKHQRNIERILAAPDHARDAWLDRYGWRRPSLLVSNVASRWAMACGQASV